MQAGQGRSTDLHPLLAARCGHCDGQLERPPRSNRVVARPRPWRRSGLGTRTHAKARCPPSTGAAPRVPSPARPLSPDLVAAPVVGGQPGEVRVWPAVRVRAPPGSRDPVLVARNPAAPGRGWGVGRGGVREARRKSWRLCGASPCVRVPRPERRHGRGLAAPRPRLRQAVALAQPDMPAAVLERPLLNSPAKSATSRLPPFRHAVRDAGSSDQQLLCRLVDGCPGRGRPVGCWHDRSLNPAPRCQVKRCGVVPAAAVPAPASTPKRSTRPTPTTLNRA